jgi:predicted MFS family arabinose efflux permease
VTAGRTLTERVAGDHGRSTSAENRRSRPGRGRSRRGRPESTATERTSTAEAIEVDSTGLTVPTAFGRWTVTRSDVVRRTISRSIPTAGALRREGGGWVLGSVAIGWLLILGARFAVPALVPRLKTAFGIDNATVGIAISMTWITYALMQFPAGVLVDRIGERGLLAASVAVTAASMVAFGLAPAFGVFLLAAALFGLGTGLYGPARATVLSTVYPRNDGAAFGVMLGAGSLGAAAFPLAVTLLADRLGWRLAIASLAPFFLIAGVSLWRAIPRRAVDSDAGESGRERARAVLAAITTRPVAVGVGAATCMLFAFQGLTAFLPAYLVAAKGLSGTTAAGLYALLFISAAVSQSSAGRAADRFGDRVVLVAVTAVSVPPLVALPFVGGLPVLAVLVSLLGVRLAIAPVTNTYVVDVLPEELQGTAWGLLRTCFFLIGATGSTFVGALADAGFFDEAFLALGVITAVAALLYTVLPAR